MEPVARNMECINRVVSSLADSRGTLEMLRGGSLVRRPFSEVARDVSRCVEFFRSLGISTRERIGFIGSNRYEWVVADLACLAMGLVSVPFDQHETREAGQLVAAYDLQVILTDREDLIAESPAVHSFEALLDSPPIPYPLCGYRYSSDDVISIRFTSGSTEVPKALAAKAKSADDSIAAVQELFRHESGDKLLVFLPLQLLQQRYWIYSAILFHFAVVVVSAAHALAVGRIAQPTVIMGVPEFFESLRGSIIKDLRKSIFRRSMFAAYRILNRCTFGALSKTMRLPQVKKRLGGRVRYLWTGSAPASDQTLRFFEEMGVPLLQGYGMNEVCIVSKNTLRHNRRGSVGKLLPNKEVRIGPDGEVQVRCVYEVADSYLYCAPGENESTFLSDGFVATGDLGYLDADGYLYISGRKKDLIVLSSGKKINPNKIEHQVQGFGLTECCMASAPDTRHIVLLLRRRPGVDRAAIDAMIGAVNWTLASEERICGTHEIPEAFSVENGLLTSQFKLRRALISEKFGSEINSALGPSRPVRSSES
jgi:long-chain acyl-CoA synthetase